MWSGQPLRVHQPRPAGGTHKSSLKPLQVVTEKVGTPGADKGKSGNQEFGNLPTKS